MEEPPNAMTSFASLVLPASVVLSEPLAERLEGALLTSISETIIEALSERELDAFEQALRTEDEAVLRAFLEERAPQLAPLIDASVVEMRSFADAVLPALA